jgi:RNA polymerase sigma-70 factor, ECF subfamily
MALVPPSLQSTPPALDCLYPMKEESTDERMDVELLEKVGRGDRDGLRELYDRYSGAVYSMAYRVLNNETETQDLLQEVFLQIWQKAALYDPTRGKPLTWVMSLARNKAIDRLRSLQRRSRLHDEIQKESQSVDPINSGDSRDEVYAQETGRVVRGAVMELSKEQRQAIEMAYFSGLTQNEIAERLNEPLGTIKARIRRGMLRLKDILADKL